VDASEHSRFREFLEVAPDRVWRDGERCGQLNSNHLAITAQLLEDQLAALGGQHSAYSSIKDY
jgi:hypothetical protein